MAMKRMPDTNAVGRLSISADAPPVTGTVTRYELPGLGALNFVMTGALGDAHSAAPKTAGNSASSAVRKV